MRTRTLVIAALLLLLAGAAAHYAWAEAAKDPLDEPLVVTKRMWVDLVCVLNSSDARQYVFDANTSTIIGTSRLPITQGPAQAARHRATVEQTLGRIKTLIDPAIPNAATRVNMGA